MRKYILMSLMAFTLMALPNVTKAQSLDPYFEILNDFNRIKPYQNPNWERSRNTLKSKILDRKNRVIGDLNDIVITPEGAIASLNVELNRLRLGDVFLNYNNLNINAASRSYIMGYDDDQIEEFYPELIANIETASGDDADTISAKSLINATVKSDDGRRIAKVEDIMFSERGDRAEALILRVNYKTVRGETVALPFSSVEYVAKGSRFEIRLADQQAETILEFADRQ